MNYAPGVSPESGRYIMQGLGMAQQNQAQLLQWLGSYLQRQHEGNQAGATMEAMAGAGGPGAGTPGFDAAADPNGDVTAEEQPEHPMVQRGRQASAIENLLKSYAPEAKDAHTAIKSLSVDQKEGLLKGLVMQQSAQEHAAKMEDYQAQAIERRQRAADSATVGQFVNNYHNAPPVAESVPSSGSPEEQDAGFAPPGGSSVVMRPPTHQERMAYATSRLGRAGGRALDMAMSVIEKGNAAGPGDEAPRPYTSPTGNKYVQLRHTLMRDTPGVTDASDVEAPAGYEAVSDGKGGVKYLPVKDKPPAKLPTVASGALSNAAGDIADAESKLGSTDEELKAGDALKRDPATLRKVYARKLETARRTAKTIIDTHQQLGFFGAEQRDALYGQYGLKPAGRSGGAGSSTDVQTIIEEANDAIKRGADPVKVKARLKEKYGIEVK